MKVGAGGALKIRWKAEDTIAMEDYLSMTKEEYEDTYGEQVIYCRVHHITGIDGCIACEQEEQESAEEEEYKV
jgi:hypothetical protein|tara:strand:+ start:1315 stop:1533 length:219 start_codon:yes stop_codon:yes gene_type:complete